jgi:GMP synthase (glutamine-hydrolysing)
MVDTKDAGMYRKLISELQKYCPHVRVIGVTATPFKGDGVWLTAGENPLFTGIASKIKTHHNRVDRVLELQKQGKVLEPLAELFKDEVRALGAVLGIDHDILWRHPFPGPGLAVRCPGEVTEEKLRIIRECDAIYMQRLRETGWYGKVWQAYAALIPVKTVGVKGDERSYEWAISIRAVTSEDAMTADWARLPFEVLASISNEILNHVKGINRVLYDISTKPPASIEWE